MHWDAAFSDWISCFVNFQSNIGLLIFFTPKREAELKSIILLGKSFYSNFQMDWENSAWLNKKSVFSMVVLLIVFMCFLGLFVFILSTFLGSSTKIYSIRIWNFLLLCFVTKQDIRLASNIFLVQLYTLFWVACVTLYSKFFGAGCLLFHKKEFLVTLCFVFLQIDYPISLIEFDNIEPLCGLSRSLSMSFVASIPSSPYNFNQLWLFTPAWFNAAILESPNCFVFHPDLNFHIIDRN